MTITRPGHPVARLIARPPLLAASDVELSEDLYTIGRSNTCQIVIPDGVFAEKLVSRLHAKIERTGLRYMLTDLGSANGTYVNGRQIQQSFLLSDGDGLGFGTTTTLLVFADPDPTFMPNTKLNFDERTMTFTIGRKALGLTPKQTRLLLYLYRHAGVVCTRDGCAATIWSDDDEGLAPGSLDEHISNIRAKFRALGLPDPIKTKRGIGYILEL